MNMNDFNSRFNPMAYMGALGGQPQQRTPWTQIGAPQPQPGPLSGMLDPQVALPIAAQLIGGRTLQDSLAGGLAAAGPAIGQMKQKQAVNAWLQAGAPKDPNHPAMKALLEAAPELAMKYAGGQLGAGGAAQYGMTPVWGRDPKTGKTVLMQMSDKGGISPVDTGGIEPLDPLHFINQGDQILPVGSRTGQPRDEAAGGGAVPINVQAKSAAQAAGQVQGAAQINLPAVENAGSRLKGAIDDALNDPNLSAVTGPIESQWPNWLRSGGSQRAQSRIDQILGGTFLQAYNDLRGGGQISDAEGRGAKDAYNRLLSTGMSDDDYRKALIEFRDEVDKLVEVARKKAGGADHPAPSKDGVVKAEDYFK